MTSSKYGAAILVIGVLLQGCTTEPGKNSRKNIDAAAEPIASGNVSILPPGPVTPNPYLQQKTSVNTTAAQQFTNATRAMRNKQWQQAQALLEQIVAQHPNLSGAWLNLGLAYRAQGEDQRAEHAFMSAIGANRTNVNAYNQLAILQREQGRFNDAEAQYKKALAVWPFHADTHRNIGILYDLYLGKNAEALAHFEAYQQLQSHGDKQVAGWIADLQRRLGITPTPKPTPAVDVSKVTPVDEPINDISSGEASIERAPIEEPTGTDAPAP